jgi:molybdopterin molybdotransferase
MLGMADETRWRLPLAADLRKKPGNASIQKAALRMHADGSARVHSLRGQESFRIAPLREANVWMLLPEAGEHVGAGTLVDVLPPSHMQAALLGSENA